jgi:nitroreductase
MARRPWEIAQHLPEDAGPDDKLRAAVDYAVLAPSGHNTQPWKFKIVDETLELWGKEARRSSARIRVRPRLNFRLRISALQLECLACLQGLRLSSPYYPYAPRNVPPYFLARVWQLISSCFAGLFYLASPSLTTGGALESSPSQVGALRG